MYKSERNSGETNIPKEIIIGSHARGELSMSEIEKIIIKFEGEDIVIYDGEKIYNIDEVKHPEMILDSWGYRSVTFKQKLVSSKNELLKRQLLQTFRLHYSAVFEEYYYLNGERYRLHDISKNLIYFFDNTKGLKYSFLRSFQTVLLLLLVSKTPSFFSQDLQPSIENKVIYLRDNGVLNHYQSKRIVRIYNKLIQINYKIHVLKLDLTLSNLIIRVDGLEELLTEAIEILQFLYKLNIEN